MKVSDKQRDFSLKHVLPVWITQPDMACSLPPAILLHPLTETHTNTHTIHGRSYKTNCVSHRVAVLVHFSAFLSYSHICTTCWNISSEVKDCSNVSNLNGPYRLCFIKPYSTRYFISNNWIFGPSQAEDSLASKTYTSLSFKVIR